MLQYKEDLYKKDFLWNIIDVSHALSKPHAVILADFSETFDIADWDFLILCVGYGYNFIRLIQIAHNSIQSKIKIYDQSLPWPF